MPNWMHFVNWWWMGAWMVLWLLLIGAVGYAAALVAWRHSSSDPEARGPKSA